MTTPTSTPSVEQTKRIAQILGDMNIRAVARATNLNQNSLYRLRSGKIEKNNRKTTEKLMAYFLSRGVKVD